MPVVLPTAESIEEHLQHVEQIVINAISSAAPEMRNVLQQLQDDLARFWPQSLPPLPDIKMPSLGAFEVPPPPPPLPVPKSTLERSADWVGAHPWKAVGLGIGIAGVGVLVGYGGRWHLRSRRSRRHGVVGSNAESKGDRRQVVVVLGGDEPLALPLITSLQQCGYIVIASVRTPEAAVELEHHSEGYLRAIVLDPTDLATIPPFLRSLSATMSRRFPVTASGDPHSSPTTQLYIHSVVSMITMPSPHLVPPTGPLENLGVQDSYPAYLQASHFVPLQVLQSVLPLMRNSPRHAKKRIVVCLPAIDGRVGLPFAGAQAMSAAATLRGLEVLRREIRVAAATETTDSHARSMKNVRVVVVDVGNCGQALHYYDEDVEHATIDWTASEKATYGIAFANALAGSSYVGTRSRLGAESQQFVRALVSLISDGTKDPRIGGNIPAGMRLTLSRLRQWLQGDRIGVGAGAWTYAVASKLPSAILDGLLTLPHVLLSLRTAFLALPGRNTSVPRYPSPASAPIVSQPPPPPSQPQPSVELDDAGHETLSENGSDADVESSSGYGSGVGESWISLQRDAEQAWR
ncbi:hypothetical protein BC835DRAFT_1382913 [Cytidiella melzeri]|nr:hypothetical protein BC835DRAFT_1382913 [Cytidiella melzeri]